MVFQQVSVLDAEVTAVNKIDIYKNFFKELIFGGEEQKINTQKILSISDVGKCSRSNKVGIGSARNGVFL